MVELQRNVMVLIINKFPIFLIRSPFMPLHPYIIHRELLQFLSYAFRIPYVTIQIIYIYISSYIIWTEYCLTYKLSQTYDITLFLRIIESNYFYFASLHEALENEKKESNKR
ncbi:hypothetical protein, unlikely [Trypanosoma brucei brucei TREU927]|uniref:Uncharacterized protein n=1 Tax=Trypanosoma brucei brucei (strain 927/4 GUTat10.1) TaxID=185431 RepID=Q9N955_TRYB2|nr:hypothetical protein, unlikely [Trypanosoma brucei brucei TREU927]CAB95322.1 hypothetical protein, unlikely [Trypanosoma brucei brucei TREU927]